ncbi:MULTISPECIES: hypothetical protein [unclassified Spirosoma]|uniref:TapB family protein n=1 Tax=unclassified Spirosoma TaxID=2621999 RepID=UPI00095E0BC0|nr:MULTISPECIES: hypothetical protein [unclassified Spirosoma]MBN8821801.1 hypothetical protein [Spirosoma sp.]OJW80709.1 MAG: hypothetical protein BGO59_35185 [Spirosoma sp. 48-14]
MKTLTLSLLLIFSILINAQAQECLGIPFKSGMSFELSHFNAKEKLTGKVNYQVKDVRKEGGSTVVDITALFEDDKGKQRPPYTIRYTCSGNELVADMSGMLQSMQSTMKDMEMRLKSNKLVYPAKLSVGQKLDDGKMEADMLNNGTTMMTMNMTMTNRQVDGKESITTPAGTFDTYKISSDVSFENRAMGIPIRSSMRVVSYRTDNNIFDIKSETYNKNGKLLGSSVLTKVN